MSDNYYSNNSKEFIESTINCDMSNVYAFFEKYIDKDAKTLLDIGFGSGRDSLYFSKKYKVTSIDPTEEFCEYGKSIGLNNVLCITAQDMEFNNEFDAIWACASLLHVPSNELPEVFNKCYKALKPNGVMYCSFKYGEYEGERKGRFFVDLTENSFNELIKDTDFQIIDTLITEDVRPDRIEKWLNIVIKKYTKNVVF